MGLPDLILTQREGLVLRRFAPDHAQAIFELIDGSRAHLSQHGSPTSRNYKTLGDVERSIISPENPDRRRYGIWNDNTLVGSINFTPHPRKLIGEIGYYLGKSHVGNQYMTDSVRALTSCAFDNNVKTLFGFVALGNDKSAATLLRAGYEFVFDTRKKDGTITRGFFKYNECISRRQRCRRA